MSGWVLISGGEHVPEEMQSTEGGEHSPYNAWCANQAAMQRKAQAGKRTINYDAQGDALAAKIAGYNAPIALTHMGGGVYKGSGSEYAIRNLCEHFYDIQQKVVNMQPVKSVDLEVHGNDVTITLEFGK